MIMYFVVFQILKIETFCQTAPEKKKKNLHLEMSELKTWAETNVHCKVVTLDTSHEEMSELKAWA